MSLGLLARRCPDADLVPTPADLDRVRAATLCLVNQQRAARRLVRLRESPVLDAIAHRRSTDMVVHEYFAHVRPVCGAGRTTAENIAVGTGVLATPEATVLKWMSSPRHRANILNPAFSQTGIDALAAIPAVLGLRGPGATYTQCFRGAR